MANARSETAACDAECEPAGSAPRERTVTLKEVPRQARRGSGGPSVFQTLVQTSTGVLVVKPGEWLSLISQSGWAVTGATGDLLTFTNSGSGTTVTYTVVIVGRTVAA